MFVWSDGRLAPAIPADGGVAMVAPLVIRSLRRGTAGVEQPRAIGAADAAMARYAQGDDAAFAALYDALAARLHGYIRRQVRDAARSDDLLQETFLRIHRARGAFAPGAPVVPWAFAIARRLVLDAVRRDQRTPVFADDDGPVLAAPGLAGDGPEQLADARRSARRLAEALARLPDSQRAAFGLLKEDGLTLAEAAAVLGVTVTAVKLRAHRAYEALRAALGEGIGRLPEGTP